MPKRQLKKKSFKCSKQQCFFIGFWFGFIAAMKVTVENYYDYIWCSLTMTIMMMMTKLDAVLIMMIIMVSSRPIIIYLLPTTILVRKNILVIEFKRLGFSKKKKTKIKMFYKRFLNFVLSFCLLNLWFEVGLFFCFYFPSVIWVN